MVQEILTERKSGWGMLAVPDVAGWLCTMPCPYTKGLAEPPDPSKWANSLYRWMNFLSRCPGQGSLRCHSHEPIGSHGLQGQEYPSRMCTCIHDPTCADPMLGHVEHIFIVDP